MSRSQSSKNVVPAAVATGDPTVGTIGDGALVDGTDGAVDKTDGASEGGLYSEPSEDPTERPNGEDTISAYETDDGTRPRRSEETGDETGDERFVEARDHLESGLTTPMETSGRMSLDDGLTNSKFHEQV